MTTRECWHNGMFFGVAAGATGSLFLALSVTLVHVWPSALPAFWLLALPSLSWGNWVMWRATRQDMYRFEAEWYRQAARQSDDMRPPDVAAGDGHRDEPAPRDVDPFSEFMWCQRRLWRLGVRGLDAGVEADGLRARSAVCWRQMSKAQRTRADQERGDVWKYACEDDDG